MAITPFGSSVVIILVFTKISGMKKNMGSIDRLMRLCVAAFLGAVYFFSGTTGGWAIAMIVVVDVLVLTSLIGTCPLYIPFGIDTHSTQENRSAGNP